MELESDMELTGIVFKEEFCEEEDGMAVFRQAVPCGGELDTLNNAEGETTHIDGIETLSLSNIEGIKQEHVLSDDIAIKQEHPWTDPSNSKANVTADYSSTEEEDLSADIGRKEPLDDKLGESEFKIEIIEQEVNAEPSSAADADILNCKHCNYTCLGRDVLDKHVRRKHVHIGRSGKYKCNRCAYSTDNFSCMRRHQLGHTGERLFHCDKCDRPFTQQGGLTQHIRVVHDRLRPHSCSVCAKMFALAGDLTRHQRIHSGTSVVQCEHCGKQFNRRTNYNRHMKLHDGVKVHKCQVCSARFGSRRHLTEHMQTHTAERPYACRHCSAMFSRQSNMKKHVISAHTHDYKHRCELCGKGYVRIRDQQRHSGKCSS